MMYHPTTRVLTVLELLQAHPGISGAELATRLEVDRRTVRRYIMMLQDMGIPVEAERGPAGGYNLRPGFRLPPLMLAEDEALAVTLSLMAARRAGTVELEPLERAMAKIERVLPAALRDQVQAVQAVSMAVETQATPRAPGSLLLRLGVATRQTRQLMIEYRSGDRLTQRRVDPYGLVNHWDRWYLAGYCHLRQDLRVFRVDRIVLARIEDQVFSPPRNFDSLGLVLESLARSQAGWAVEVMLHTDLADARRRVPAGRALLTQGPEGVRLRANVENLDWLARVLLTLECPLTIVAPPELRRAMRALGESVIAMSTD